jgi:tetratricopeptide (TPR) repeat protein
MKLLKQYFEAWRSEKRGAQLYGQAEFAAAADAYLRATALRPGHALNYYNLGLALYKAGRRKEGREAWERGLELVRGQNAYLEEQFRIVLRQFA